MLLLKMALAVTAIAAGLLAAPASANGSTEIDTGMTGGRDAVVIEGSDSGASGGGPADNPESGDASPPSADPVSEEVPPPMEPFWAVHPVTGEPCIGLVAQPSLGHDSPLAVEWLARIEAMLGDPRLAEVEGRFCQGPGPVADPSGAAHSFIRSIPIPVPEPRIAPGVAVTGLTSYLEIEGQEAFTEAEPIEGFGDLEVEFAPVSFEVDWGDDTHTVVDDGRVGASWRESRTDPDAAIRHTYAERDPDVVVSVTARWVASWRVGGFSGRVAGLTSEASFPIPVHEYRAVRLTPGS